MNFFKGQVVFDTRRKKKVVIDEKFSGDCWFTRDYWEEDPEWYEIGFEEDFEEVVY